VDTTRDASPTRVPDAADGGHTVLDSGAGGPVDAGPPPPVLGGQCSTEGALGCSGQAQALQIICQSGAWTLGTACASGMNCDTRPGATLGTCQPILRECAKAAPGDVICNGSDRVQCGPDLVSADVLETCSGALPVCLDGACVTKPSCASLLPMCGAKSNDDCCASDPVDGGMFARSYDGVTYIDNGNPATVSAYRLDRYEVTVGRFRTFLLQYDKWRAAGHPFDGEGANPSIAGTGWSSGWNALIPSKAALLGAAVKCGGQTWTDGASSGDSLPINCVTWLEAIAFCTWDGGRLSTEAEWNYAAAGGSDQRVYPWSVPSTSTLIDDSHAAYCGGHCTAPVRPGSYSPAGDGKFGHADLAGNLAEWTFDPVGPYGNPCVDCVNIGPLDTRVVRGGSFGDDSSQLLTSAASPLGATSRSATVGIRCARAP
jgi:formylglycine-generating enzyme required for sulfatase activity